MAKNWASFEDRVRGVAQHIWGVPCEAKRIGGVNIDGFVRNDNEGCILIEMTVERTVEKVRGDITKLTTAKAALFAKGILAKCFCVLNGSVTQAMKEAAKPHYIRVVSADDFSKLFFDFHAYKTTREMAPFGSAVNPLTGERDQTAYVAVKYLAEGRKTEVSTAEIASWVRSGKRVVLLGEYGSGKSRCLHEVFKLLSAGAHEEFCYPFAIDLRKSWGLIRGKEIIRRHFDDLGLDKLQPAAIRAFNAGSVSLLIDGFDEIGSQAWSNDAVKLAEIRARALSGVKDLFFNSSSGMLITGREHYFPSNDEMFSALGLTKNTTTILRCKEEFSEEELQEYFTERKIYVDIPSWLPRRPLICQTISDLPDVDFEAMFGDDGGEVAFWDRFIRILCARDARIHPSFDPDTIYQLFLSLARLTRTKSANVGPISLTDIQNSFEAVVGKAPVEEASAMLQRLPSLGRIGTESTDRQFVDIYILDGLRAKDVTNLSVSDEATIASVTSAAWINPLDDLGQRILRRDAREGALLQLASRAAASKNRVLASDIVASLVREGPEDIDFGGILLDQGEFLRLSLTERNISNISITNSIVSVLVTPSRGATNVRIENCMAGRVIGVTAASGLPSWIEGLKGEQYDSVESVSRIRRIGLGPSHEILITIIRKTFFQKGSGRKEEALLRGLGAIGSPNLAPKILNILIREQVIEKFKGDSGLVYAPVRSKTSRMKKLLEDLRGSDDPLWTEVGSL